MLDASASPAAFVFTWCRRMKWEASSVSPEDVVSAGTIAVHLRMDDTDAIGSFLTDVLGRAAVQFAEDSMACALPPQTITATFYEGDVIRLPRTPMRSITSVVDGAGNTISPSDYSVRGIGHAVFVDVENVTYPLIITYAAGYADVAAIPAKFKLAILQHIATMWASPESASEKTRAPVPHSLEAFYALNRRSAPVG